MLVLQIVREDRKVFVFDCESVEEDGEVSGVYDSVEEGVGVCVVWEKGED